MTKPFNPLELTARVKSQLRRYTQLGSTIDKSNQAVYAVGGLSIDDEQKEVTVDGEPVRLTPIEYNILLLLVKIRGKYFLSIRYMKVSGMRMLSEWIIQWQYISAISERRSRSIRRSRDT